MLEKIGFYFKGINWRHILLDLPLIALSLYLSIYLRVGPDEYYTYLETTHAYVIISVLCRLGVFLLLRVYNILWRFVSANDVFRLTQAVLLSSAIIITVSFLFSDQFGRMPRSVYFIDSMVVLFMLLGVRLARRLQYEIKHGQEVKGASDRAIIYGAGSNGRTLALRLNSDPHLNLRLVGFIDDSEAKVGLKINNVPVMGGLNDLDSILEKTEANTVFIAISRVDNSLLQKVVKICARHHIKPRLISEFSGGEGRFSFARKVELRDLLNRQPREMDLQKIEKLIRGKRVLITGAGGSIGAEVSRQIFQHNPSRLILLDHSEYNLFEIDKELRKTTNSLEQVAPVLLDIKDGAAIETTMKKYTPEVIIHAAAYKHVHLVEVNPYSAIINNILGTLNLLEASVFSSVESFVMISTDKAVNPAGVMGATKRVCELLVTAYAMKTGRNYCSVRFGNVLGSSGSLIPTLRQQIRKGGPVTVTHQDMTRYFMLIPEAVSLVLTAASLSRPGDINVLKMGEPVKILDIAKNLIALSGKTEDEIPIVFTGIRPGEKMYEELYIRGDELKTDHPDILTLPRGDAAIFNDSTSIRSMEKLVDELIAFAQDANERALYLLNELAKPQFSVENLDEVLAQHSSKH
ncbi:MAG: polysaccharide biosynthesis protein [Bdellovibrionales bacterium]|nr:polysaccharide biosynthesis protein [Bdellovibrionales bacterium]